MFLYSLESEHLTNKWKSLNVSMLVRFSVAVLQIEEAGCVFAGQSFQRKDDKKRKGRLCRFWIVQMSFLSSCQVTTEKRLEKERDFRDECFVYLDKWSGWMWMGKREKPIWCHPSPFFGVWTMTYSSRWSLLGGPPVCAGVSCHTPRDLHHGSRTRTFSSAAMDETDPSALALISKYT